MIRRISLLAICLLAFLCINAAEPLAYVLDLNDEVDSRMWLKTKRACHEAKDMQADIMIVHINTYGGAVDAADSIRTALLRLPIPTVAFVNTNAASAGALITLACDSVYMAPGASYGASSVVNQAGEIMPDKYQSYMRSVMRSTAEHHGKIFNEADSVWVWRRDPSVAESFVGPEHVTTFTPEEAINAGYAEGTANTVDEVIRHHIDGEYRTAHFHSTTTEEIIGFLASAGVRAVLIMLILGGIYMEMHTPGLGFAGGVAFVAAVLYFLPLVVEGTMAPWVVVLFIIGILLLAMEIFVIPGFGICGIAGIIAILASLVGGMLNGDSIESSYAVDIVHAVVITTSGLVMAVLAVWFLTSKYGPQCIRRVSELQATQKIDDGYIGVDMVPAHYIGKKGIAVTDLRPAGKIEIDGKEFDAVSLSGYIDSHRQVKAIKYENAQLYVRKIEE